MVQLVFEPTTPVARAPRQPAFEVWDTYPVPARFITVVYGTGHHWRAAGLRGTYLTRVCAAFAVIDQTTTKGARS